MQVGDGVVGGIVFTLFLLGLTLPIELIVVPLYFDLRQAGLINSYLGGSN